MSAGQGPPAAAAGPRTTGRIVALIRLGRPLHLVGGAALHAVGAALAWHAGAPVDARALAWGQLVITAAQLVTHYANDYYDQAADAAVRHRARWSGGSKVLPAGLLPPRAALWAAAVAAGAAALAALVLATSIRPGAATAGLLALAIALAWGYSGPPLRLAARGLGEVGGAAILALLTPMVGYHLQRGPAPLDALVALIPLAALQLAMLLVVSLPDVEGDRAGGKRTWAVRRGRAAAARAAALATAGAYAALPALWRLGAPPPALAAYAAWLPVAAWQAAALWRTGGGDPASWDRRAFWAIGLVVGSALSVAAALVGTG